MLLAGVRGTQLTLTSGQPVERERKEQLRLKIERIQTDNYPSSCEKLNCDSSEFYRPTILDKFCLFLFTREAAGYIC